MKVVSQAPTRISLFGGGTDVGEYAQKYGGICLNMAINIRQRVELGIGDEELLPTDNRDFFCAFMPEKNGKLDVRHRFYGSEIESGLGSSAALAVALVGGLARSEGKILSRDQVAELAWEIEVRQLGLFGGRQDQYAAAFGGVNLLEFGQLTRATPLSPGFIEPLIPTLTLFYLGKNRKSPLIQEGLREITVDQKRRLDEVKDIATIGIKKLADKDPEGVGLLIDMAWEAKKKSNKGVSNAEIDRIYKKAKKLGAWGGKVLGAGGGGHILFVSPPEVREKLIKNLGIKWIDFSVDWNGLETRVVEP